jgi:hypothetical protein
LQINIEISDDITVVKRGSENIINKKTLTTETQLIWNVKTEVMSVTTEVTATIKK